MDPNLAKAGADAASKVLNESVLGSLLILSLVVCFLLGYLLYRSWSDRGLLQSTCQSTVVDLQKTFQLAINEVQEKRIAEVSQLSRALSENASNNALLVQSINSRTPIQERMATSLELMIVEQKAFREMWDRRFTAVENGLAELRRGS